MNLKRYLLILLLINCVLIFTSPALNIKGISDTSIPGAKISSVFELKSNTINGETLYINENAIGRDVSSFDSNMMFKSMTIKRFRNDEFNIIEVFKHDYLEIIYTTNKKSLLITQSLDGKEVSSKKVKVKGDFKIFNNLFFTLRTSLQKGEKDFESFLIFPESSSGYKASFKQYKNYTEFYGLGSKYSDDVVVYEVGLLGIASKFFPHKFYFAFTDDENYNFVAYWGGNPETPNKYLAYIKEGDK